MEDCALFEPPKQTVNWGVIYPSSRYDMTDAFVQNMIRVAGKAGLNLKSEPVYYELGQYPRGNEYQTGLKEMHTKHGAGIDFYLVVLPEKGSPSYADVKRISNTELGIATQCVVFPARAGPKDKTSTGAYLTNVLAGINPKLKLGCMNTVIKPALLSQYLGNKVKVESLVVFGLDVYHGETQSNDRPSIVAMCTSINQYHSKYSSCFRKQTSRKELVVEFSSMLEETMQQHLKERKAMPDHVIFYRDGVGEGMYDQVKEQELSKLQTVLTKIASGYKKGCPKITLLVAQKRNHLRCVAPQGYKGNPDPGTLISDPKVVDHGDPNFYLYSHKALAGTARPTHYQVLHDDHNFQVEELAMITYALAHLHQGCSKSVSIPAPIFYADRAAFQAGACYREDVEKLKVDLKNTLFML